MPGAAGFARAEDEEKEDRGGDRDRGGEDAEKDVLFHDRLKN